MDLSYLIVRTLQRYSSRTKPLTGKEIFEKMEEIYKDADITQKKVRVSLNKLVEMESCLSDEEKTVRYRVYHTKSGEERRTNYYYNNILSDVELRFLIDSISYSTMFSREEAKDFATRIQRMAGKTTYLKDGFAKDGVSNIIYKLNTDTKDAMECILRALYTGENIYFRLNEYDVNNSKIMLKEVDAIKAKPIKLVLVKGAYYLISKDLYTDEIYKNPVDCIKKVGIFEKKDQEIKTAVNPVLVKKAEYELKHPQMEGDEVRKYIIRVYREFLNEAVEDFVDNMSVISSSITDATVDIKVLATPAGLAKWLIAHNHAAWLKEGDSEINKIMKDTISQMYDRYCK